MWVLLMLIAFLLNGLSAFGLRVLAGMGLTANYTAQYLFYYYLTGMVILAIILVAKMLKPTKTEAGIGALMALCSISGNTALAFALSNYDIPGNIAFPISNGGSLFLVVITGVLLFRERLGRYGIAGCALGALSIIFLGIS